MRDNISTGVYILTQNDLDERTQKAFMRGVERGRFEERMAIGKEPVALNCSHWKAGHCDTCGAQHQGMEVSADYKCPHFTRKSP